MRPPPKGTEIQRKGEKVSVRRKRSRKSKPEPQREGGGIDSQRRSWGGTDSEKFGGSKVKRLKRGGQRPGEGDRDRERERNRKLGKEIPYPPSLELVLASIISWVDNYRRLLPGLHASTCTLTESSLCS